MEPPKILAQHVWLSRLVGEWLPGQAPGASGPGECHSRESVRSMGGLWLLLEGKMDMPDGQEFTYLTTLGFDPQTGRFVGSWIGSMMNTYWQYDGELNADGTELTLHCEGPFFDDPNSKTRYKDIMTIHSPNHRSVRGMMLNREGVWEQFMESHYYRA